MSRTAGLKHLVPRVLGIVGAGQLGTGVADLAARHGFEGIIVHDVSQKALCKVRMLLLSHSGMDSSPSFVQCVPARAGAPAGHVRV